MTRTLRRAWYEAELADFLSADPDAVIGSLASNSSFDVDVSQREAWLAEIALLKDGLAGHSGTLFLEFEIPRMGQRADAILLSGPLVFVIEFKIGEKRFERSAIEQVWDYALDLKNFHEGSHDVAIVPILVATDATKSSRLEVEFAPDKVSRPLAVSPTDLPKAIDAALTAASGPSISPSQWASARYLPTPTIVEAARALYAQHSVEAIARHDAGAKNLRVTSQRIEELIDEAQRLERKVICFVTGVPGAGKTLVGLNIATRRRDEHSPSHAVYLSGNGPLVAVLRAALTRDEKDRRSATGESNPKHRSANPVKAFIQNVHHFRDEGLRDDRPPADRVAIFDEAQRAWNERKTIDFMRRRKNQPNFRDSEPGFLISYLDRHPDWAAIICLVGGGQEIHTGEAGIGEWLRALNVRFPHWHAYISDRLTDSEYAAGGALDALLARPNVHLDDSLHLAVSMRSFRAEHVSSFVKAVLDCEVETARQHLARLRDRYPIVVTRNLDQAKRWIRERARGSERYGMVASSKAMRLKPHAIDVRVTINPVHWFLNDRNDTRSSYYLEDCATEFQVQGLELDWVCVNWDADLRFNGSGWSFHDFRGTRWTNVHNPENQAYLRNAYRVLLTRARQGMVIFVPPGDSTDPTRNPGYYDNTYRYLKNIGIPELVSH